jgi:ribosome-associated protein
LARRKKVTDTSAQLADVIIDAIKEKKGSEIVLLNLKEISNSVCDYFIVCSGDSSTQVSAIANSIDEEVKKQLKEDAWRKEGFQNAEWILLDYVTVVVHIFQPEARNFYRIEKLWSDAEIKVISAVK